jgi:hypothetical protein
MATSGFKLIYDVRQLLRNYNITDEDLLTDRQIEFWIMSQRAMWIKRRDSAFIKIDHSLSQVLTEDVISVDRSMVPTDVPAQYRILRTQRKLPRLINFTTWDGVVSAGPVDLASDRFNHKEYREAIASGNGRFNKTQIFSFIFNDYLYIISKGVKNYWYLLSQVGVVGIFEDPREVGNFKHVTGETCWSLNDDYPISLDIWEFMKDQIKKNNIKELYTIPVDKSNDDNTSKTDNP